MVTLDVSVPSPRSLEKARLFFGEDAAAAAHEEKEDYRRDSVVQLVKARGGWLAVFFVGLMLAALVVEAFESMLREHVELSFMLPLIIGHGGNTGSQSNATIIRSLALGHIRPADWLTVVWKECVAGTWMGGALGLVILGFSYIWSGMSAQVGLVVAISLPIVSCWANLLGGLFPLLSVQMGLNPAVTSAPLMTTCVDSTGLLIYFLVAKVVMGI